MKIKLTTHYNKYCLSIILCFLFKAVLSQNVSVNWSDKIKSTSGAFNGAVYIKSLAGNSEDLIAVFGLRSKKFQTAGWGDELNYFPNIKLTKFNKTLELEKEFDIEFPVNSKRGYLDFVKLNNNYYIISFTTDKSAQTMDILYQRVDISTFAFIEQNPTLLSTFNLADYEKSNRIGPSDLDIDYSPDSSKLLITYQPDVRKKENQPILFVVADDKMKKLNQATYSFNEIAKKIRVNNSSIDNDGKVYLSFNQYEKDYSRDYIKSDGDKIPGFTTKIAIIDGAKQNVFSFENEGKFVHQSGIAYDEKKQICIVGLYKEKHNGRITGVFKATINEAKKTIGSPAIFQEFPKEILEKVDKDGMGDNGTRKPGLDNDFRLRYTLSIVPQGTIYLVLEFNDINETSSNMGTLYREVWGDIVTATFNTGSNNADIAIIPKKQVAVLSAGELVSRKYYGYKFIAESFEAIYHNDNLLLFYNDDEDNLNRKFEKKPEMMTNPKKSLLMMVAIDKAGKIVTKKDILSHRDYDGYMTNMSFSYLKENIYGLFAINIGMFKFGIKVGTLTIK